MKVVQIKCTLVVPCKNNFLKKQTQHSIWQCFFRVCTEMRWQIEGETELMHVINENVMREMKSDSRDSRGDVGMCRGDNIERIFRYI